MSQSLKCLIQEAQQTILQIRNHPDYKRIAPDYSPDLTLGDAATALTYLQWEVEQRTTIDVAFLEAFSS
ncbi:MAG: hypothetical protein KAF91_31965 [Nostoc sp. TH1S01]|nr:hypothetical protein [Nostoc sp. TH1S01]